MKRTRGLLKSISVFTGILLASQALIGTFPAELVHAEDDKDQEVIKIKEEQEGDITINNQWHGPYYAIYNDNMFLKDTRAESTDLAKLGSVLAEAAYSESYITNLYEEMGFSAANYNYDKRETYEDNDFVGYTLGYKEIEGNRVFLVSIRGTHGDCDWYSNFNLGSGDTHLGFSKSASKLMDDLDEYLEQYHASDSSMHNIIYFTGHSRGAAVANLLAGWCSEGAYPYFNESNVFAYTFATPNVKRGANQKLRNIHNYVNPGDKIPAMPLSSWGFERYGQTHILDIGGDTFQNFLFRFEKQKESEETYEKYGGELDNVAFTTLLQGIVPDQETYLDKQYIFYLIATFLAQDNSSNAPEDHRFYYLAAKVLDQFKGEFKDFQIRSILDSVSYGLYTTLTGAEDVTELLASTFIEIEKKYTEVSNAIDNAELAYNDYFRAKDEAEKNERDFSFNSWSRGWSSEIGTAAYLTDQSIEDIDDLANAIKLLKELYNKLMAVKSDDENAFRIFGALIGDLGNNSDATFLTSAKRGIEHAHLPLTYYLWVGSMYFGYYGWAGYKAEIDKMVIPDKITRINPGCFNGCTGIKEFVIPDTVISLRGAISGCSALRYLTIPVDRCGDSSFDDSQILTLHFTYGKSGRMPDENPYTEDSYYRNYQLLTHRNSDSITTVVFDDDITYIGTNAFCDCPGLINLTLPASITEIPSGTFYRCSALKEVELPAGVTKLGYNSFSECVSLSSINLHDGIRSIGENCFKGDTLLKINPQLPKNLISIGKSCFSDCSSLCSEIIIPDSVEEVDDYSFYNTPITKVTMPCDLKFYPYSNEEKPITEYVFTKGKTGVVRSYRISGWNGGSAVQKVTLCEGITKLDKEAFKESSVPEYVLPSTLTEIGDSAFEGCKALTSLALPKNLKTIGGHAFYSSGLTSVVLPDSVVYQYDGDDYYNYKSDLSWFGSCTDLTKVVLSKNMNAIMPYMFSGCTALTDITLPEGIKTIGTYAFNGCEALAEIKLPDSLTSIESGAFESCPSLVNIVIPKNVSFIGAAAFNNYNAKKDCNDRKVTIYNPDCDIALETSYSRVFNSNETIYGYSNSSARTAAKHYGLTFVPLDPAYTVGDVNSDTEVSVADAVALQRYVNKWDKITIHKEAADLNRDGSVSLIDAMILSRAVAGWGGYDKYLILIPKEQEQEKTPEQEERTDEK
ncbi:MAG: leucine-rich repeat protein [Oscillospiraceae bacterium]|nr:leucine-rich repeat protein [Oscillospiraceae bacterium]